MYAQTWASYSALYRFRRLSVIAICSDWYLKMDAAVIQGGLEVNYQNNDDEEAEFEREELERQNEVKQHFHKAV